MHIVVVRVSKEENGIQIQLDIASTITVKTSLSAYLTNSLESYVNIDGEFSVEEGHTNYYVTMTKSDQDPFMMPVNTITLKTEANPKLLTGLLFEIENYFKKNMGENNYYLGLGNHSLQLHLPLDEVTQTFLPPIMYDSHDLPPFVMAEYIANEIVKIDPTCAILKAMTLTNQSLSDETRSALVDEIKTQIDKKLIKTEAAEYTLTRITKRSIERFLPPCHELFLPGSKGYGNSFTQVALLRDAFFVVNVDGNLVIDLTQNEPYLHHYAPGKALHGKLEKELKMVAKALHLEFSPETDWQTKLVFTKTCSAFLTKQGIAVLSEFFSAEELLAKRDEQEEVCKENAIESVNIRELFSIFEPSSNGSTGVENEKKAEDGLRRGISSRGYSTS